MFFPKGRTPIHSSLTLGIDPAKNKFTACLPSADGRPAMKSRYYAADREGFGALTKDLRPHREGVQRVGDVPEPFFLWLLLLFGA